MSINFEAAASSAFQAQAAAALYSPMLQRPQEQELAPEAKVDNRLEVPLDELTFRQLKTTDEIARIVHLRKEIQLVAASGEDPAFVAREKKETSRASWLLSSAAAPSSGPFASYQ